MVALYNLCVRTTTVEWIQKKGKLKRRREVPAGPRSGEARKRQGDMVFGERAACSADCVLGKVE